jgi:hypothetical protein
VIRVVIITGLIARLGSVRTQKKKTQESFTIISKKSFAIWGKKDSRVVYDYFKKNESFTIWRQLQLICLKELQFICDDAAKQGHEFGNASVIESRILVTGGSQLNKA